MREIVAGATYFVSSRLDHKQMGLKDFEVKAQFIIFLTEVQKKHPFKLYDFCVMDNHIHLVLRPEEGESLSLIMQLIKWRFAMWYNGKFGTCGHVWGNRFHSEVVTDEAHLAKVLHYTDENPVTAHLVGTPEQWVFSGVFFHRHGIFAGDFPELEGWASNRRVALPAVHGRLLTKGEAWVIKMVKRLNYLKTMAAMNPGMN